MTDKTADSTADVGNITVETRGRVRLIGIDRPAKYNGFTPEMIRQLAEAYQGVEDDPEVFCTLLHTTGKHFTAGLQLDRFDVTSDLGTAGLTDPLDLREPRRKKPVVAAVRGICFTIGIELMLAADVVVAGEGSRFGQLEVSRGLMAYGGATARMVERAGWGNAMRWLLTGEQFDAAEALRVGFVQEVVPDEAVFKRGLELAERIAAQAPLAVQATRRSSRLASEEGMAAALAIMGEQMQALSESEDFAEGVKSFVERRDGRYTGR